MKRERIRLGDILIGRGGSAQEEEDAETPALHDPRIAHVTLIMRPFSSEAGTFIQDDYAYRMPDWLSLTLA